jgi:phenylalanyl-tRNA synthetase beta chain
MKISLNWLRDFIDLKEKDAKKIKEIITANSAEIETMESMGELLKHIVLAKVEKLEQHPDADKLKLATVNDGKSKITVVCGGSNLKEDMQIAFASEGTTVQLGGKGGEMVKLKKVKIRGVESRGMICASTEIGLGEMFPITQEKEIVDLSHIDAPLGTSLDKALGLDDTVIDIDNHAITNRWDLFSHTGFAREFVANGLGKWKKREEFKIPKNDNPPPIEYVAKDPETGTRYSAVYITNVTVKASPQWLQKRLSAAGVRPISNLVDITNYVMKEMGTPLHAFDMDQIKGRTWTERLSKKGETVVTLDQQRHELDEGVIVFEDGEEIFDLCGIMGGYNSGINAKTNKIWLHAPVYNHKRVRIASRKLGHISDASIVFEKGIDEAASIKGLARAVELILECCPEAQVASRVLDVKRFKEEKRVLTLRQSQIERLVGVNIPQKEVSRILTDLGFEVETKKDTYHVTVPSWRLKDVAIEADLIEEVARIYGYDNIPTTAPQTENTPPAMNPHRTYERQLKNQLVGLGFDEIYTFAFLGPELLGKCGMAADAKTIELTNPISTDMSLMRQSLLPRTLETVEANLRYHSNFRLFELTHIYERAAAVAHQAPALICTTVGEDFRDLQGVIEHLGFHIQPVTGKTDSRAHPGRNANIVTRGKNVGFLYEVHPKILKKIDIKARVVVAEVKVQAIHDMNIEHHKKYQVLPTYPSIVLDVSIAIPRKDMAEKYNKAIGKTDKTLITSVDLVDEYTGEKIDANQRALTYSITYRAEDRTLTDAEVDGIHKKVIESLKKEGATIR